MSKEHYSTYLADNELGKLNKELVNEIVSLNPISVLEFGCGTGKNLKEIQRLNKRDKTYVYGIDVSLIGLQHANIKNEIDYLALGDQDWLSKLYGFDVVFTCSVLDHIENVSPIIKEMQRMAKHVFLAETNDVPGEYYYPHKYKSYGFTKLNFEWVSTGDGATYHIWKWNYIPSGETGDSFGSPHWYGADFAHDDLAK